MEKLKNERVLNLFIKYLIPSVTGSLAIGVLIFIDTVFIGRGVGSMGLAALNTVLPMFTLYSSTGLLLGVGGATAAAIDLGRGKKESKKELFGTSLTTAILITIIYILIQRIFLDKIIIALGATNEVYPLAKEYLNIISLFTGFYLVPHTLNIFIRNDGNPNIAMWGMVVCGVVNIILDYIFIFPMNMGMKGASLATGIAQTSYFLVLLTHFFTKKNTLSLRLIKIKSKNLKRIFKIGGPSFVNDVSSGVSIFIFNWVLFTVAGEKSVSAFSIILNINFLVYLIYVGVSQGAQPIISVNYGGKLYKRVDKVNKYGIITNITVALLVTGISYFGAKPIIYLFNNSDKELFEISLKAMPKFFSASLFMGINIYLANFFQSIEQSKVSALLIFLRGLGLITLGLFILPKFIGVDGIWYATLFAETITLILTLFFYTITYKKISNN